MCMVWMMLSVYSLCMCCVFARVSVSNVRNEPNIGINELYASRWDAYREIKYIIFYIEHPQRTRKINGECLYVR